MNLDRDAQRGRWRQAAGGAYEVARALGGNSGKYAGQRGAR